MEQERQETRKGITNKVKEQLIGERVREASRAFQYRGSQIFCLEVIVKELDGKRNRRNAFGTTWFLVHPGNFPTEDGSF